MLILLKFPDMKKIYIVAIVMIAVAIALLTNAASDVSTYSSFEEARTTGREVKIAGQLSKDKEMIYEPAVNANQFSFYITDTKGEERLVHLNAAKPQDFEKSEQIVVTGKMNGEAFVASEVLMKCPSKYKDEEVYIKSEQGS